MVNKSAQTLTGYEGIGSNADDSIAVYDYPLPSRRKCLCNMHQDAGDVFCRCAMTCGSEFASASAKYKFFVIIIIIYIRYVKI